MELTVNIDSTSNVALHKQIYDEFRIAILSGRLAAGEKVPSTRALSRSLGVSRATVTMAYDSLLGEGYLKASTGSGTFISRELPEDLLRPGDGVTAESSTIPESKSALGAEPPGADSPDPLEMSAKLSWYGASLKERDWLAFEHEEPEIQFTFGRPDLLQFPMRVWNQLLLQHARRRFLNSLDSPANAGGHEQLREQIALYLGRARALTCDAEQVIIVNGSQQALDLVSRVLLDRGDSVCIEEPCYIGAHKAFEAQGAMLVAIAVDAHGLNVELLKKQVEGRSQPKLVYLTPSHQYPTGCVLSLPRRLELISWAKRSGAFIVEDDYDSEFRYKGRPVPALAGFDHGGTVIYIGTFSKVLLPSLRLGYLVVPRHLVDVFTRAKWLADRHSPLLEQQALADFIRLGHLERHIRRMRRLYEEKRKLVLSTLVDLLGDNVTIYGDNAGINVLVKVRTRNKDRDIVDFCWRGGVGLASTAQFYSGPAPEHEYILNYGSLSNRQIEDGLRVFASAVLKCLPLPDEKSSPFRGDRRTPHKT